MYLIRKSYTATPKNINFNNESKSHRTWIYGKKEYSITNQEFLESRWLREGILQEAFSTKAAACRAFKACQEMCDWEESFGYWKVSCEIFQV